MKIRFDRLFKAIDRLKSETAGWKTENMANFTLDIEVIEADLNKGIPMSGFVLKTEWEDPEPPKDGSSNKYQATLEVFDDMDGKECVLTIVKKKTF